MAKSKKQKLNITLERPIVFFDLETDGRDVAKDKIVSLAVLKIMPGGTREEKSIMVNSGRPIPADTTKIHGITDEMVKDKPPFSQYAKGIYEFFEGCDIAGFNSNRFDVPLLSEEFSRCNINFPPPDAKLLDASIIYHSKEPRTLSAGYKFYLGKELKDAHDATADVNAACEIFFKQIEKYDDLKDIDSIAKFCNTDKRIDLSGKLTRDNDGDAVYNFGQHRGVKVSKEPKYALWMLTANFSINTKSCLRIILQNLGVEIPE